MKKGNIQNLIVKSLKDSESNLRALVGFKMNLSANEGFHKFFFSVSCDCGTAALLSVEVSEDKSDNEIETAMISIIDRLIMQERSFGKMDCKVHETMKKGFIPDNS